MKRALIFTMLCVLLLACAVPALAADKLAFAERNITIFEGDTIVPELIREGKYEQDGTFTFTTNRSKIISVSEDGEVTGLLKGDATLTCAMKTADGRTQKCTANVKVARRVTEVELNTKRLSVYASDDPAVASLLTEDTEYPVLVIPAKKTIELSATAYPSDATNRALIYETSDPTVAVIQSTRVIKGVEAGECDLIISSKQNPEVTQIFRVVVVQPVTKLTLSAESKAVPVGGTMQISVAYTPEDATMREVTWSSDNTNILTVDETGMVYGVKRGSANVKATAADGSGKTASYHVNVEQGPESVTLKTGSDIINVGASRTLSATVLPSNTNNKAVTWTTSDERVATVTKNGTVKGIGVGTCTLTCTCDADPGVCATMEMTVQQPVQKIVFTASSVTMDVNNSAYVMWNVEPATATNPAVTLKSSNEKIAVVDQNGRVTGIKKGSCKIVATAADGSKKTGSIAVKVTQPVNGVYFRQNLYHLPYREYMTVHAYTEPKDADNQAMSWYTTESYIAAVTTPHSNSNYTRLYGNELGRTTFNVVTDDGHYTASSTVMVDHYNDPVRINDLYASGNNIRVNFWNKTSMCLTRIYFTVDMYNRAGLPLHCAADGTNRVTGYYMSPLQPGAVTEHAYFHFDNYIQPSQAIGGMILRVTGYRTNSQYTLDGVTKEYSLTIAEDKQPEMRYPQGFEPTLFKTEPEMENNGGV